MHGALLHGFKTFVVTAHGAQAWTDIVKSSGGGDWYVATTIYPDQEMFALVNATATQLQLPVATVLEQFGSAIVETLLRLYGPFVDPGWRTLDLLEHAETVIHRTIRLRDAAADPPRLQGRRASPDEVQIQYTSQRRLCALAVGICHGVAAHFGEVVTVEQPECMEHGAAACRLIIRRVAPG
jgi:hypothetical protein